MKILTLPKNVIFIAALSVIVISHSQLFAQWLPDVRLTNNYATSFISNNNARCIASNGDTLHVVWTDARGGFAQIFYKHSTDGGLSWGADTQLTNDTWYFTGWPSITVSGLIVNVVWVYNHNALNILYLKRSTDGGNTWAPATTFNFGSDQVMFPSIAGFDNNVIIVFNDPQYVFSYSSTDGGVGWTRKTVSDGSAQSSSSRACVSISGALVHVVWVDTRDGNPEIYYGRSTDKGFTWNPNVRLTNDPDTSWYPCISASGAYVNSVWQDNRDGNWEIYNKRSTDGGITWSADTRLTNDADTSWYPSIFSSGLATHVVWQDHRTGNWEIFYKRSTNGGAVWSADTRLTNDTAFSLYPSVTTMGSSINVVWSDNRDSNYELYFKQDASGNIFNSVSGTVTYADNGQPVNNGFVKALKYDNVTGNIITIDSTSINADGSYTLVRMPRDSTDIMFYQNDDNLDFVPTYYVSTVDWRQATKIYANQNLTGINGRVFRINGAVNPYSISGMTTYNTNQGQTPVSDAIIYVQSGNVYKNYGISNGSGSYAADKLAQGSYTLTAYRMGFNPVSQNVTITNGNVQNINFNFGSPIGIQPISCADSVEV